MRSEERSIKARKRRSRRQLARALFERRGHLIEGGGQPIQLAGAAASPGARPQVAVVQPPGRAQHGAYGAQHHAFAQQQGRGEGGERDDEQRDQVAAQAGVGVRQRQPFRQADADVERCARIV